MADIVACHLLQSVYQYEFSNAMLITSKRKSVKSSPNHMALISVSVALSQISAYAAKPSIRHRCIAWCACLRPGLRRYQILLGERGTWV